MNAVCICQHLAFVSLILAQLQIHDLVGAPTATQATPTRGDTALSITPNLPALTSAAAQWVNSKPISGAAGESLDSDRIFLPRKTLFSILTVAADSEKLRRANLSGTSIRISSEPEPEPVWAENYEYFLENTSEPELESTTSDIVESSLGVLSSTKSVSTELYTTGSILTPGLNRSRHMSPKLPQPRL